MALLRTGTRGFLILAGILICLSWDAARADYLPFGWDLGTVVTDIATSPATVDSEHLTAVQSPFAQTSFVAVNQNWAQSQYQFNFQPDEGLGNFSIDVASHIASQTDILASSEGFFFVATDATMPMHIDNSLFYAHAPGDLVDVFFRFSVVDVAQSFPPLFHVALHGGNLTLHPSSGTLVIAGDPLLEAGKTYRISWTARADTISEPSPAGPVDASGYIHFSFLPEPASAFTLLAGFVMLRHRRLRHR